MAYTPKNPNGAATSAASSPVVLASDQSSLSTTDVNLGAASDTSAASDTGTFSLVSLIKRLLTKIPPTGLTLPTQSDNFIPIAQVPQKTWRNGFDRVIVAGFDTVWMNTLVTGTGMTLAQVSGSAVITTGTTANSETIGRSLVPFDGSLTLRYSHNLSQRIANQTFFVELVDVIGDNLAYVINSATSVTVTFVGSNPFTSANVGQSMYLGKLAGTASTISARYAIASVSGLTVTFTVAGWPASGSGTVSLFGWNYHHVYYDSTTATLCNFDSQRNGWNSGETNATINTTAGTGHVGVYGVTDGKTVFSDQTSVSSTTLELTQRGSRVRNVPVDGTQLYLQLRAVNGSTAPASTTTWTVGFVEIDNFILNQVSINNIVPQSANSALPVQVLNTPAVTISSGTVTTVSTVSSVSAVIAGTGATNLGKAEDAVAASGDTGVATLYVRNDALTSNVSAAGDYINPVTDLYGATIVKDQQLHKRTYRMAFIVVPATAATDVLQIIGSATTTVEITEISISGTQTTGGMFDLFVQKRSTANTGGTSSATTNVSCNSADAAATAVGTIYTANPSALGTTVGNVYIQSVPLATTTDKTNNIVTIKFGDGGKPVQLVGVAQALALNLGGVTLTGASVKITVQFSEF